MNSKSLNLAVVSNNTFEAKKTLNLQHYDISSALQTSLEFNQLISIFSNKIQNVIAHSAYEYRNTEFGLDIKNGIVTRNSYTYALKFEDQDLGELKLMRSKRFLQSEIRLLETLLCCLIYPLRNATLFQRAQKMAFTDPLTKVNNRASFNDTINRELQLAIRNKRHLSLVFLDIDHFKNLNDTYGHDCGDVALNSVAGWIKQALRGSDIVFRYGGEEFVVILSDTDLEGANIIAERIRNEICSHTLAYGINALEITASIGVSSLTANDTAASLLQRADSAMYMAKNSGRNQVKVA